MAFGKLSYKKKAASGRTRANAGELLSNKPAVIRPHSRLSGSIDAGCATRTKAELTSGRTNIPDFCIALHDRHSLACEKTGAAFMVSWD